MPSCQGTYRGRRFRSLLELSYFIFWEEQGLDLSRDVMYEHFRIPYRIGRGKERVYVPDFYFPKLRLIVELKHSSKLGTKMNLAKFEAAQKFAEAGGLLFEIMTEEDVKPKRLAVLAENLDIKWSPGTLKRRRFKKIIQTAQKRCTCDEYMSVHGGPFCEKHMRKR